MHASDGRKWLEGAFPDAESRRYCFIFDAAAVLFGGELLGGLFGAGAAEAGGAALGAGALGAGAGEAAAITLPELLVSGAAPAAFGGTEAAALGGAAGAGAGFAGSELASVLGGGAELAGPAAAGMGALDLGFSGGGGGMSGTPISPGAGGDLPVPGSAPNLTPGSAMPASASSAATAGVAPVPAGIAPEATATGTFTPAGGGPIDFGGGGDSLLSGLTGSGGSIIPQGVKDAFQIGGPLVAGGALVNNLMSGNKTLPGEKQVHQAANSLTATAGAQANKGMELESFINSGALPPGLASGLKTATSAAEANIKSGYAQRGMSGSSAEAQDIQAAHERAQQSAAQIALQLLQQGSSMVGQAVNTESLAANIYSSIMQNALQQDEALGKSIGAFASALAGAGGGNSNTLRITTGG